MNGKGNLKSYRVKLVGSAMTKIIRAKSVREKEGSYEFLDEDNDLVALIPRERMEFIIKEE